MGKHLLVTVSEDKSALWGARFVGSFFPDKRDMKLTLFYIAPNVDAISKEERGALEQAGEVLRSLGFGPDQVETKLVQRRFSTVMEIMREGHKGGYDAVVLGRSGLCWLEDYLEKSVSNELFQEPGVAFPVWVCRRPDFNRKNVLVCVDGSEPSCRIADHVGFMLARETRHRVTILYVDKPGRTTGPDPAGDILPTCEEVLRAKGLSADRIETRVVEADDPVKAILSEALRGRFAVVAVGRKGAGRGMIKKPFMGSVSYALFKLLDGVTLWCCR